MSEHYLKRVAAEALRLFEQNAEYLPDERYSIETDWESKHATRIVIRVSNEAVGHWVCDEPLTEIANELNHRFESDRHYAGIELEVSADWADGYGENIEDVRIGATLRVKRSEHG